MVLEVRRVITFTEKEGNKEDAEESFWGSDQILLIDLVGSYTDFCALWS